MNNRTDRSLVELFRVRSHRSASTRNVGKRTARVEWLEQRDLLAVFSVQNVADSGPGSLRQAIEDANAQVGADVIKFASGVKGIIELTSGEMAITDDLSIDGPGAGSLTINGGDESRVFRIDGATVDAVIRELRLAEGYAGGVEALGGAILNHRANLTLSDVVLADNRAISDGSNIAVAGGGAVANVHGASLTVARSEFAGNESFATTRGVGGAILNDAASSLIVDQGTFTNNRATGLFDPSHSNVFGAAGGAIANLGRNSVTTITNSNFVGNQARGGDAQPGKTGGNATGGAIVNTASLLVNGQRATGGRLVIESSTFSMNHSLAGEGGDAETGGAGGIAMGGAITNELAGCTSIFDTEFFQNTAVGGAGGSSSSSASGGSGGNGIGGSIGNWRAELIVERTNFVGNRAVGGAGGSGLAAGGTGGDAKGGVMHAPGFNAWSFLSWPSTIEFRDVLVEGNEALAGAGGDGGAGAGGRGGIAQGGGVSMNVGTMSVVGGMFDVNRAIGGEGGTGAARGSGGNSFGGAVSNNPATPENGPAAAGVLDIASSVFKNNSVVGGAGAIAGFANGGGISNGGRFSNSFARTTLTDTAIHDNLASGGFGGMVGGDARGGGVFNGFGSTLIVTHSTITQNTAQGGLATEDGEGIGGGVYNASGGNVCMDSLSLIVGNFASDSDDDVFGTLCLI